MTTEYAANFLSAQQLLDALVRVRINRDAIIEECAKVAENMYKNHLDPVTEFGMVPDAIRALKSDASG